MADVQFFKVSTLPATLEASSFYFVPHATENWAESYVTDTAGVAHSIGNTNMIADISAEQIGPGSLQVVQDITERDALGLTETDPARLVLVVDATADVDVDTGGALYAWRPNAGTAGEWRLIIAYSDMTYDFSTIDIDWSQLTSAPTSTVAEIDQAVTDSHTHANKAVIDALADDAGNLTYNGASLSATIEWATLNW